ncbi:hypothetical protein VCHA53O464_50088 [Vibrio chagasii]|nr:hypothetical protein VCHA53O464_50088 [Vibrio chagasii]
MSSNGKIALHSKLLYNLAPIKYVSPLSKVMHAFDSKSLQTVNKVDTNASK